MKSSQWESNILVIFDVLRFSTRLKSINFHNFFHVPQVEKQKQRLNSLLLKLLAKKSTKGALDASYLLDMGRRNRKKPAQPRPATPTQNWWCLFVLSCFVYSFFCYFIFIDCGLTLSLCQCIKFFFLLFFFTPSLLIDLYFSRFIRWNEWL